MKVSITVTETTTYNKIVEMPEEEFKQLCDDLDDGTPKERKAAEKKLCKLVPTDSEHWLDADFQSVEIEEAE